VKTTLLAMGAWLQVNGEAIYGSRPWLLYGEGPTKVTSSARNTDRQQFTAEDIRFTSHNGALYAIALGRPANGELLIHTLFRGNPYLDGPVCAVRLMGLADALQWSQQGDGLRIELPQSVPEEPAYTFRITFRNMESKGGHCDSGKQSASTPQK
jgi:alpha-L-fucosidase